MKACIIQPPYSRDVAFSDEYFEYKLDLLDKCDESIDIIVLPEYSDVPCATTGKEDTFYYHKKYIDTLLDKCIETAKRCNALVFVNALYEINDNYRNTTYVFNQRGERVGMYFKKHLPPLELNVLELDSDYTYEYQQPYVLEIDGLRYGFLTCYDFYFYEAFANIARQNVDIIIGCSLQRSDSHDAIETMCRFLAYNTNAYVIRSSVSFSEDSDICGASMVVSPYGKVLENMYGRFGMATVEFDPKDKYYKPAGFGNPDAPHYEYIEFGRKPWQYRNCGSAIVNGDKEMKYPRVCAQGGFGAPLVPDTMASFGAAVAADADEIAFELCSAKDGELKVCGCDTLFSDILRKLSGHVIMNVRISPSAFTDDMIKKAIELIYQYDCQEHIYFTLETDTHISQVKDIAPKLPVCMCGGDTVLDRAIELGCSKIELSADNCTRDIIDKAHGCGIKCTVVCAADSAKMLLDMGVDTIITNDYNSISQTVKE